MNKQIVRLTYSVLDGKPSDRVEYISSPISGFGQEALTTEIDKAHIFDITDPRYVDAQISGSNRDGAYTYKQKVLRLKIEIEAENKASA